MTENATTDARVERFVSQPFFSRDGVDVHNRDCREMLAEIDDSSIDLIVTDPPYFKVNGDDWDWQWDKPEEFLTWMGSLCDEWQRVLKPNGSLYVFASPQMAWGVEGEVRKRFNVLNRIRWNKKGENIERRHVAQIVDSDLARAYLPACEEIIFAEHFGADNIAKGEAGWVAKCDELRGFVFEPLRAYFAKYSTCDTLDAILDVFRRDGRYKSEESVKAHAAIKMGTNPARWDLCDAKIYSELRMVLSLPREYEDLRREYEDLRREYEDLRRPFNVSADVPYTDVWDFPTVGAYEGKHPCQKPIEMLRHIVTASSKPGAMVLDCFAGSGVTGQACKELGRRCILVEKDPHWARAAAIWLDRPHAYIPTPKPKDTRPTLFPDYEDGVA